MIKAKPVDVKSNIYIDSSKEINNKDPKLKSLILLEYQNITFLQKVALQISLKKFLSLKKLKILCGGHILLVTLNEKKLLGRFTKTNCEKQIKVNLELKK